MIYDRVLARADSTEALEGVRRLVTAERFHARVAVQSQGDSAEQWHVEVDLPREQWYAVSQTGRVSERRDGTTFHDGAPVERETRLADEAPTPLQLAFFDRMLWWGQLEHGFWPVLARRIGRRSMIMTFEHGADPAMASTLVIDTELGMVSRVMNFNSPYVVLLDAEPGRGVERLVPEAWPELEVVYPEY